MANLQIREALRRAMVEEMQKDDSIFLMGEEVAHYNGAYKVSQGMLEQFGEERIIDTPISEWFTILCTLGRRPGLKLHKHVIDVLEQFLRIFITLLFVHVQAL